MKTIKVKFNNFWHMENIEHDPAFRLIRHFFSVNNYIIIIDEKSPHIVFHSIKHDKNGPVFPYIDKNVLNVFFTRENLNAHGYQDFYLPKIDKFDFVLGFEKQKNSIRIPYYFFSGELYDKSSKDWRIIKKNHAVNFDVRSGVCLISKNPHFLRIELLKRLNKNGIKVDCPGNVGRNIKSIDNKNFKSITSYPSCGENKISFLNKYIFNICPENSWNKFYTTEKLYHASIGGCIPIYWGCDEYDDGFYNKNRILSIDRDIKNINKICREIKILLYDKNKLFNLFSEPLFSNKRYEIINYYNQEISSSFNKMGKLIF